MVIFAAKNMILDSVKSFEKYKTLVPLLPGHKGFRI